MRLQILDRGQRLRARLAIRMIGATSRTKPDDIARIILYRPGYFGRRFLRLMRSVMRGPSDWTVGERELFAAFVSRRNSCTFCVGVHSHVTTLATGVAISTDDLDDWSNGPFSEPVKAVMGLLAKVVRSPQELTPQDVDAVRDAGVSDEAIYDALHVAFQFNVINRLADAFGASFEGEQGRQLTAAGLYRMGYDVPGFFVR
jgi:uncharacterized peroxidase-related enzyme